MSHQYYNDQWTKAMEDLGQLWNFEQKGPPATEQPEDSEGKGYPVNQDELFDYHAELYIKYLSVFRLLQECYDQIIDPQKGESIKKTLNNVIHKLLIHKEKIIHISPDVGITNFPNLDEYLTKFNIPQKDLNVSVPKFFRDEPVNSCSVNNLKILQDAIKEVGDQFITPKVAQKKCKWAPMPREKAINTFLRVECWRQYCDFASVQITMTLLKFSPRDQVKVIESFEDSISGDQFQTDELLTVATVLKSTRYGIETDDRRIVHSMHYEMLCLEVPAKKFQGDASQDELAAIAIQKNWKRYVARKKFIEAQQADLAFLGMVEQTSDQLSKNSIISDVSISSYIDTSNVLTNEKECESRQNRRKERLIDYNRNKKLIRDEINKNKGSIKHAVRTDMWQWLTYMKNRKADTPRFFDPEGTARVLEANSAGLQQKAEIDVLGVKKDNVWQPGEWPKSLHGYRWGYLKRDLELESAEEEITEEKQEDTNKKDKGKSKKKPEKKEKGGKKEKKEKKKKKKKGKKGKGDPFMDDIVEAKMNPQFVPVAEDPKNNLQREVEHFQKRWAKKMKVVDDVNIAPGYDLNVIRQEEKQKKINVFAKQKKKGAKATPFDTVTKQLNAVRSQFGLEVFTGSKKKKKGKKGKKKKKK